MSRVITDIKKSMETLAFVKLSYYQIFLTGTKERTCSSTYSQIFREKDIMRIILTHTLASQPRFSNKLEYLSLRAINYIFQNSYVE